MDRITEVSEPKYGELRKGFTVVGKDYSFYTRNASICSTFTPVDRTYPSSSSAIAWYSPILTRFK